MSWFFRKLQKLWDTATQLCSPIPLLSGFVLWTSELYLCLVLLEFLVLQKTAFPMRCYLHFPCLLHAQTLISLKQFSYHKHKPPILISLDISVEGAVNVKCSTTVMFMDHLWKASFRQAAANAGGINSSHRLMLPLTTHLDVPAFSCCHCWGNSCLIQCQECLTPNQGPLTVNVMSTKSGNHIQHAGREAALKLYVIGQFG